MQFSELSLKPEILHALEEMGFAEATDIQAGAIPAILAGSDVTGRSSTGTGKTAAFGLPAVQMASECDDKASVLILSPTRELAMQIAGEIRKFAKYLPGISCGVVYGGAAMDNQIRQLRTAKIVIGTPGRIMDHLRRRTLKLDNLHTVILDEADEMLNMGFVDDIHTILESAPEERQTVLLSATMPPAILKIMQDFQKDPVMITVDGGKKTVDGITQNFYNIPQAGKIDALKLLIEYHRPKRALVFCNTKKMVDELCASLCEGGFRAAGLHGDLKQSQRNTVMSEFKSGRANILIATDVAARGIDVEDVEAVFNYDIPQEYEYYIHRIGRTGRAGKAGASHTLVANRNQLMRLREIERYIGAQISEQPVPSLESIAEHRMTDFADDLRSRLTDGVDDGWRDFVHSLVEEGFAAEDIAAVLCERAQSRNKRLASVRNVTSISSSGKKSFGIQAAAPGRCWVRTTIGSDAKIGPNFIVGAIVEGTGLPASSIGKINIYSDHTDIDLANEDADRVITEMKNAKIKGRAVSFSKAAESGRGASRGGFGRKTRDFGARREFRGKPKKDGYHSHRDSKSHSRFNEG